MGVDILAGALTGQLLVLAQDRRQFQPLEMMLEEQLGRFGGRGHDEGPAIKAPWSVG